MEQVIFPEGWEKKYKEFYKAISNYQRKGKNAHDDAPDALTGFVEMINMEIARGYEKDTITGRMIYPCEMYQTTEQNTEKEEEQKSEQQIEEEE